jgi:hypothetical protein
MLRSFPVVAGAVALASVFSTAAVSQERAGAAIRVQPDSFQRTGFFRSDLDAGDEIIREARLTTEKYGSVDILFEDGTSMVISPNSEVVVDEFVYSPGSTTGKAVISLGTGALRMISGRMASESYQVKTRVATIGVRGTEFLLDTGTEGVTKIWVEDGTVLATPVASNQTFEFNAPAYAECSASACEDQSPGEPPVSFPSVPPFGGEGGDDAGGIDDPNESEGTDF